MKIIKLEPNDSIQYIEVGSTTLLYVDGVLMESSVNTKPIYDYSYTPTHTYY